MSSRPPDPSGDQPTSSTERNGASRSDAGSASPDESAGAGGGPPRPAIKRKRGGLACFGCRARKTKCDAARPSCGPCIANEMDCRWPEGDRRKMRRKKINVYPDEIVLGSSNLANNIANMLRQNGQVVAAPSAGLNGAGPSAGFPPAQPYNQHQQPQNQHQPQYQQQQQQAQQYQHPSPSSRNPHGFGTQPIEWQHQIDPQLGYGGSQHSGYPENVGRRSSEMLPPGSGYNLQMGNQSVQSRPAWSPSPSAMAGPSSATRQMSSAPSGSIRDESFDTAGMENVAAANDLLSLMQQRPGTAQSTRSMQGVQPGPSARPNTDNQLGINTGADAHKLSYEYIRPYGPTAIKPGLGRLRLSIRDNAIGARPAAPVGLAPVGGQQSWTPRSDDHNSPFSGRPLMDPRTRLPREDLRQGLFDVFFQHFSSLFPFLDRQSVEDRLHNNARVDTALMANTMCALSARFSDDPEIVAMSQQRFCRGMAFADTAKQMLIPLLGMPSPDVVAALLFMAWYEIGMNSEAGQWAYVGLAMRMITDLGGHRLIHWQARPQSHRTLFWCVYLIDRIISIGTGRPVTFLDEHIDIPQPDIDGDLGPSSDEKKTTLAFAYNIRLAVQLGKVAQIVNSSTQWLRSFGRASALHSKAPSPTREGEQDASQSRQYQGELGAILDDPAHKQELDTLLQTENDIVSAYESLPEEVKWSAENLLTHIKAGDGDMYLQLHLWYYCIIGIIYSEPFVHVRAAHAGLSLHEALEIQKSAARSIQDIITTLGTEHRHLLLNNPYINQAFYSAACTWVADIARQREHHARSTRRANSLLSASALRNFTTCAKVLREQAVVWLGVGWIAAALAERSDRLSVKSGMDKNQPDTILSQTEMRMIVDPSRLNHDAQQGGSWPVEAASDPFMDFAGNDIDLSLWGADGLFGDQDFDQLFSGLQQTADCFMAV